MGEALIQAWKSITNEVCSRLVMSVGDLNAVTTSKGYATNCVIYSPKIGLFSVFYVVEDVEMLV